MEVSYKKLWKVMMHISKRSTVELSKLQKEGVLIYDKNRFELEEVMEIKVIDAEFSVCKVADYSQVDMEQEFCFTGKTDEENSLVCLTENVPPNTTERDDGWRAFRIQGVLDFSLIGILSEISGILAENKIGIFAISTYNTDYILTKSENFDKAIKALAERGYQIVQERYKFELIKVPVFGGVAVAQRKAERRRLWLIAGLAAVIMVVLLLIDMIGWDVETILMYTTMVIPPVFGIIASACFLCYLILQILHHRAIKQTVMALVISSAVVAVWMVILPMILVVLGGFPAQE